MTKLSLILKHMPEVSVSTRTGCRLLASIAALALPNVLNAANVTVYGDTDDRDVRDNSSMGWIGESSFRVGGASSSYDAAAIYVFELPELDPGETITDASLSFYYTDLANVPSGNVDFYGLPYQTTSTVSSSQYYDGSYGGDGSATALQNDILTTSTSLGLVTTSSGGSENLVDYLNAQYAAGAEGGDFVFLRLNSDVTNESSYRYYVVATGNSSTPPYLDIEIGSGGGGSGISEDFASGASNFTEVAGGTWSVSGGRYVLSSPASAGNGLLGNISVHNTVVSGDYTVSAVVRFVGTSATWNDAALIFGYQDEDNFYYVSLNESNDSYTKGVFKIVSGSPTEMVDLGSLVFTADTDYDVEVERSGSSIIVRINDSQVASFTDSTFSGGQFGFGTKNDSAQFDDLIVSGSTSGGGQVGAPSFSPSGGTYSSSQNVTISTSTSGATIRYTVDGTSPTSTSGTVYSGAINISSTTTLKAIAYKSGMSDSNVSSASYTITTGSGAPTRVPSFGPNGTHWPDAIETPFMYDDNVQHIIEVACSWSAISSAIASVDSTEASEGVLILVQPGNLVGNGNGSTSTPVLQNLGSASWSKRVTVAPRDGWGSVTVSPGARIFKVQSVCFAGFDFDGLSFHANNRSALAWSRVSNFLSVNGTTSATISDVEIVEVVIPDSAVGGGDSVNCYSMGATEISGYRFVGVYLAPRYRPAGTSSHTDTIQFEPTSSGCDFTDVYMLDCAFFASSNCAVQVNAIDGLVVENTYIAGGATAKTRYPFTSGADTNGANNCFNGGGINMEAYDSYFIGGISGSAGSWIYAENTRTTYNGTNVPSSGSWIVDSTLDEDNPTMPPYPTTTYLNSIWGAP